MIYFFQPCSGFDLGSNACTDRTGEQDACSCFEITSASAYRLSYNITAHTKFSEQTVWLVWPGPPEYPSEIHTLPEVRGMFEILRYTGTHNLSLIKNVSKLF